MPSAPTEKPIQLHRVLREVLKMYTVFESLCSQTGHYEIEHRDIKFNFLDLKGCLAGLAPRQKEAVFWFIIMDQKQKVVAEKMGISTVTVGQYSESAMLRVAQQLWPEYYKTETEED